MRKDLLDAFDDTGVALPPDKRARMNAIVDRLEDIRQEFDRDIRDNQTRVVFSPDEVSGLPQDYLDKAKRDDKGNYLLGFEYPGIPAVHGQRRERGGASPLSVRVPEPRHAAKHRALGRGDAPAQARWRGCSACRATPNSRPAAGWSTDPQAVDKFLRDVKSAVRDVERKEIGRADRAARPATLQQAGRRGHGCSAGTPTTIRRSSEKARYSVDQEALRKYFPTDASIQWVMAISSRALRHPLRAGERAGLAPRRALLRRRRRSDRASSTAASTSIRFPRAGKFSHAAASAVRARPSARAARRSACWWPTSIAPASTSDELETLVHEFGHVMHGVLSDTALRDAGRHQSCERDFVERRRRCTRSGHGARESLSLLPQFCKPACPPVDDDLLGSFRRRACYGAGMRYSRQHLYAAYDMAAERRDRSPIRWRCGNRWKARRRSATFRARSFPAPSSTSSAATPPATTDTCGRKCSRSTCCRRIDGNLMDPVVGAVSNDGARAGQPEARGADGSRVPRPRAVQRRRSSPRSPAHGRRQCWHTKRGKTRPGESPRREQEET